MEFIIEILGYILAEILIRLPGNIILWVYHGGKKSFKNTIGENDVASLILGIFFWLVIAGLIVLILN